MLLATPNVAIIERFYCLAFCRGTTLKAVGRCIVQGHFHFCEVHQTGVMLLRQDIVAVLAAGCCYHMQIDSRVSSNFYLVSKLTLG